MTSYMLVNDLSCPFDEADLNTLFTTLNLCLKCDEKIDKITESTTGPFAPDLLGLASSCKATKDT